MTASAARRIGLPATYRPATRPMPSIFDPENTPSFVPGNGAPVGLAGVGSCPSHCSYRSTRSRSTTELGRIADTILD